jgi:hypothetical protein
VNKLLHLRCVAVTAAPSMRHYYQRHYYQMFSLDTIIEQKMKAKVEKSQN